jgi:hypothetical protein
LRYGGRTLATIAVVVAGVSPAFAGKAAKEDFYFQETPDEDTGRNCTGCINFTAKAAGQFGKDSGDCALLSGDVCNHCFCQGWTDKTAPGAKRAGT